MLRLAVTLHRRLLLVASKTTGAPLLPYLHSQLSRNLVPLLLLLLLWLASAYSKHSH
jgi:hypothetical protein